MRAGTFVCVAHNKSVYRFDSWAPEVAVNLTPTAYYHNGDAPSCRASETLAGLHCPVASTQLTSADALHDIGLLLVRMVESSPSSAASTDRTRSVLYIYRWATTLLERTAPPRAPYCNQRAHRCHCLGNDFYRMTSVDWSSIGAPMTRCLYVLRCRGQRRRQWNDLDELLSFAPIRRPPGMSSRMSGSVMGPSAVSRDCMRPAFGYARIWLHLLLSNTVPFKRDFDVRLPTMVPTFRTLPISLHLSHTPVLLFSINYPSPLFPFLTSLLIHFTSTYLEHDKLDAIVLRGAVYGMESRTFRDTVKIQQL